MGVLMLCSYLQNSTIIVVKLFILFMFCYEILSTTVIGRGIVGKDIPIMASLFLIGAYSKLRWMMRLVLVRILMKRSS